LFRFLLPKILLVEIFAAPKFQSYLEILRNKKISSCLHNHSSIIEEGGAGLPDDYQIFI